MEWFKIEDALPEQGLKVLYWHMGDCWVAWRFGIYWFPTVFTDAKLATYEPPEMWAYIDFPNSYTGKMLVEIYGKTLNIDQLEKEYPDKHNHFIEGMKKEMDSRPEKNNYRDR